MLNYKGIRARRKFDMDADWLPPKDQVFTLKTGSEGRQDEEPKPDVKPPRDLSFALKGPRLSNAELFERAYEAPGSIYTYGDTRAIAGTKGTPFLSSDWMQNFKNIGIPWITGEKVETEKTDRFQDNERARAAAPYTKKTIGHSLGGIGCHSGAAKVWRHHKHDLQHPLLGPLGQRSL